MSILREVFWYTGRMHHAYLICGEAAQAREHAYALYNYSGKEHVGNPDILELSFGYFSIEDARRLKEWAQQRPVREPRRLFIISIEQMLHEAQNALLKLFEEPPKESAFVLIVPSSEHVLPTLRSRFEVVVLHEVARTDAARAFLALTFAERLKEIAARVKEKDQVWIEGLLSSLETHAHEHTDREAERILLFVRQYIARRGASPKMLLEHLVLTLK